MGDRRAWLAIPAAGWGILVLPASALILVSLAVGRLRTVALRASAVLASTLVALGGWLVSLGHDSGAAIAVVGTATAVLSVMAARQIARSSLPR